MFDRYPADPAPLQREQPQQARNVHLGEGVVPERILPHTSNRRCTGHVMSDGEWEIDEDRLPLFARRQG